MKTANSGDAQQEFTQAEINEILAALQIVRCFTGFGSVSFDFVHGNISDVHITTQIKRKKEQAQNDNK